MTVLAWIIGALLLATVIYFSAKAVKKADEADRARLLAEKGGPTGRFRDDMGDEWIIRGWGSNGLSAYGYNPSRSGTNFRYEEALEKFPTLRAEITQKLLDKEATKIAREELEANDGRTTEAPGRNYREETEGHRTMVESG